MTLACALPPPGGGGKRGRLVLQGTPFDRSRAFRSRTLAALHRMAAHCYARRITQGKFRAVRLPEICPTHGTEPPFLPFCRATKGESRRKGGFGEAQEGAGPGPYGALAPFCPGRWAPASPPPDGGISAGTPTGRLVFPRKMLHFPLRCAHNIQYNRIVRCDNRRRFFKSVSDFEKANAEREHQADGHPRAARCAQGRAGSVHHSPCQTRSRERVPLTIAGYDREKGTVAHHLPEGRR